jgi:hypothetical protein
MMIEAFMAAAAWGSLLFMLASVTAHVNGYEKALGLAFSLFLALVAGTMWGNSK